MVAELSAIRAKLLQARLRQRGQPPCPEALTGPRRLEGDGPFPLSPAQQGLWLFDQLNPGLPTYNVGRVLRLHGSLDIGALEEALAGIVARHAIGVSKTW